MVRRLLATTALVASLALPAYAEPLAPEPAAAGTSEGAAALRASLADYVTQVPFEKGILTVEPDPAGQRVTFSGAPFLKDYFGLDAKVAPMSFLVSPRADGDWNIFTKDPIRVSFDTKIGDQVRAFDYSQGEQVFKGIFAPSLFSYREIEGSVRDTVDIQNDALTDSNTTIGGTKLAMSARPGAAGGVDIDFRQTLTDYAQTVAVKAPPPADGDETAEEAEEKASISSLLMSFGLKANEVETVASAKDARNVEGRDLYTLVLKNADAIGTDQKAALAGPFGEELRAALMKTLPFWSSLDVAVAARGASFQSMFGTLRVGEARQVTRMTGLSEKAGIDTDVSIKDLSIEGALLPPWVARFVPREATFGVAVSGLDLKAPSQLLIRDMDLKSDEPIGEALKAELVKAFDPSRITITLKPSTVRTSDLTLALSGEMTFVGKKPAATLTARAAGLDETIASLKRVAEREPDLHQVVGMVQMVQGLGHKTAEGDWEWVVDAAADGSVSVNGALLKGPDLKTLPETEAGPAEDAGQQ